MRRLECEMSQGRGQGQGRGLWTCTIGSTLVGQGLDSLVFINLSVGNLRKAEVNSLRGEIRITQAVHE